MIELITSLLIFACSNLQGVTAFPVINPLAPTAYHVARTDQKELIGVVYLGDGRYMRIYTPILFNI